MLRFRCKQPALAISSKDDYRQLPILTEEQQASPTVSLLEYLSPILPTELTKSLQTDRPQFPANIKTVPLHTSSNSLNTPSYCIGHLTIVSLSDDTNLKELISRIISLEEMSICLNILLTSSHSLYYLELSCDQCDSIYLPITSDSTELFEKFGHFLKKDRKHPTVNKTTLFNIQLVIKQDEREVSVSREREKRERGTYTHDGKIIGLRNVVSSSLTRNLADDIGVSSCMNVADETSTSEGTNAVENIMKDVLPLQLTVTN